MNLKKIKINIFFFIIIFLIFIIKLNFFSNIYTILMKNNYTRMIAYYGYCDPKGYGFIKEMNLKYNLKEYNINTINKNNLPNSNIFTFSFKKKKSPYEILINFNPEDLNNMKQNFVLIESKKKCHLIKYIND